MNAQKTNRGAPPFRGSVLFFLFGMLLAFPIRDVANAETIDPPAGAVQAVQDTVRGRVTDAVTGQPVATVNVRVAGTDIETITNAQGDYSLPAPADGSLVFSRLGYRGVEVDVGGQTRIDLVMEVSAAELQEILVTGYTAQRRADITGAVASVNMESLSRETSSSALQRLAGNVAGVTVDGSGSPGARSTVRIRGVGSFQNNDPLYIIDGTPVVESTVSPNAMGGVTPATPSSFANSLNPNDIESIQVLKDASAASIYGARASNGVVIIETKKGSAGPPRYSLDAKFGVASPYRGYDNFVILDALEYHEVVKRSHVNAGLDVPTSFYGDPDNPSIPRFTYCGDPNPVPVNGTCPGLDEGRYFWPDNLIMPGSAGTNWWDAVFSPAPVMDVNLRVSGGAATTRYNLSFNYYNQEGTAAYNRFQRGSIRLNTDFNLGRLTVGENISLSLDEGYGGLANDPGGFAEDNIVGKNVLMQPVVPVFDIAGNFASARATGLGNHTNPLKSAWANKDDVARNLRMFGNTFARFDLTDALLLNSSFSFDLGNASFTAFNQITPENSEANFTNSLNEQTNTFRDWTFTNTLNFSESFAGRHNTSILLGQAAGKVTNRFVAASIADLITTDIDTRYIQDAVGDASTKNVSSTGAFSTLLSYFGKIDYNYAERYYLSFTVRRDGSSRLAAANRWGTFPAFNVGWRLSEESFLGQGTFLSNLMLRFGWGITGNQNIAAGRTADQFSGGTGDTFYDIGGNGQIVKGLRQTALGNPDLKWEENRSTNVGLDAELFSGKLSLDVDVYQRDSDNLLFNPPLPATAGIAAPPIVNVGQVRNKGIDFGIGYRGTLGNEITWSMNISGAHYKNEIVRIDGERRFFFGPITTRFATQGTTINMLGHPIGSFYGLIQDGIFRNQAEIDQLNAVAREKTGDANAVYQDGAAPGRFRFRDVNDDGRVSAEDRTVIGDPHPDFTGGLNLGVRWRRWDFGASLFGTFGNDIFDVQKEFYVFRLFNSNVRRDLLTESAELNEAGEVINPGAKYPRMDVNDEVSRAISSFYVEDGSYVRMRSLQVGYTVPDSWTRGFGNVRVWLQGENLFTITGYSGLDPSLPAANVTAAGMDIRDQARGIDRGVYPTNRIFTLGFGIEF